MKKLVKISLVIVVVFTLVAGVIQAMPGISINVGWNSDIAADSSPDLQLAVCRTCTPPDAEVDPYVGWNSRL